jgi:hypothetical protein
MIIIAVLSAGFKGSLGEFNPFKVKPVLGTPSQGRPIPLCGTGQPWAKGVHPVGMRNKVA